MSDMMPCPECQERGHVTGVRIGNHRKHCPTCNNWAAAVRRATTRRLIAEVGQERYDRLRRVVEDELYPTVVEAWQP